MEDSPQEAGGAGNDRANPAESSKHRNLAASDPVAMNPEPEPAAHAPEPLPESVKAARRRKLALATAKQAGAQTQPDPSTPESASTVPETCPEPRLAELEAIVEKGLATFIEVGSALLEIRDSRLYHQTHKTFEDYCRERWEMSRQRAHQLIEASEVARNLSTVVDVSPTSERQVRPLAKLEPEQQCEAWKMATEATPTPTAEEVARVAESFEDRRQKREARELAEERREEREQAELQTLTHVSPEEFARIEAEERELKRRNTITKAFEQAAWFFYPNGNNPEDFAQDLLKCINPELIDWEYSKENLDEAIRVFRLVASGRDRTQGIGALS
jgi:hypothetical protein